MEQPPTPRHFANVNRQAIGPEQIHTCNRLEEIYDLASYGER